MCDGVQFDDRSPVLYLVWDSLSGTPLFGERKQYRGEEDLPRAAAFAGAVHEAQKKNGEVVRRRRLAPDRQVRSGVDANLARGADRRTGAASHRHCSWPRARVVDRPRPHRSSQDRHGSQGTLGRSPRQSCRHAAGRTRRPDRGTSATTCSSAQPVTTATSSTASMTPGSRPTRTGWSASSACRSKLFATPSDAAAPPTRW